MKKRSRKPAILAAVILAAALAVAWFHHPPEPSYQGRTLSDWIEGMNGNAHPEDGPEQNAIRALGTNSLPVLLSWLRQHDSPLKSWWTDLLSRQDWLPVHPDSKHARNEYAISAFDVLGPDAAPAVPALIRLLKDSDPLVRSDAACCLGEIGEGAGAAIPELIRTFDDTDEPVRQQSAWALGCIRENAGEIVPLLLRKLPDETPPVQQYILYALGQFGTDAKDAVPQLLQLLALHRDAEPVESDVRSAAANALGEIGSSGDKVIPALLTVLHDTDLHVRSEAAQALGKFGAQAADAVPVLLKLLPESASDAGEPDAPDLAELRGAAATALGNIQLQPETVVPALLNSILDSDDQTRQEKVQALGQFGESAKTAVPAVERLLHDEDFDVRSAATNSLLAIDPAVAGRYGIQ